MTSLSKENMAAVFRKLFRSSRKISAPEATRSVAAGNDSPARRLFRHAVQPIEAVPAAAQEINVGSRKGGQADNELRARRLMKELKDIQKLELSSKGEPNFTVELVNDNLFEWNVRLLRIDSESELAAEMRDHGVPYVQLHVSFPKNYPFNPPFMRVVSPTIEKGYVMEGGAICMELLTPRGWASAYTIEAVITQFAASLVKGQGRLAKKVKNKKEFSRHSAEESFKSLVKTHDKYGWVTPPLADG